MNDEGINVTGLPAFDDNYIWVLRRHGCAAVVDPGDAPPVLADLARHGDRLTAILLTHHHGDHVGGVGELLKHAPEATVFGPAAEGIEGVSHPLAGGEQIQVPGIGLALEVLAVPGHTRGHLAYWHAVGSPPALFCGDTLFGAGCGRLFEGTAAQMQHSLARLAALPPSTLVYCAHEYTQTNLRFAVAVEPANPAVATRVAEVASRRAQRLPTVPSTIALERETNPLLRWDAAAVITAAAIKLGRPPADAVETFATIREWRNGFR